MSKKTNTLVFILGATVFNILVTILCFLALFVLFVKFIMPQLGEASSGWGLPVIFVLAIVLSFLIYRVILKQIMKKVDMEKHFDPIFGPRRPQRKRTD
jgi:hypothetical protein